MVVFAWGPGAALVGVAAGTFLGVPLGVAAVGLASEDDRLDKETIPGASTDSSCSHTRAATSSLLNSRALCVPAATGAVKRGQSVVVACLREGSVREAARVSESWTAAMKRA